MHRQSDSEHVPIQAVLRTLAGEYETARTRVHTAYRKMRTLMRPNYAPPDVRAAAAELAEAVRDATAIAVRYLRRLQEEAPQTGRGRRHRKATRAVPTEFAAWSAELFRLTQISVWLRGTTLDQPGVHIPTTVKFSGDAGDGADRVLEEPSKLSTSGPSEARIGGVDLRAIVDSYGERSRGDATAPEH